MERKRSQPHRGPEEDRGGTGAPRDGFRADDLKKLRANPTGKLLLVSFWATWCGPCLHEFPDMETTYRMYRVRDFEFVTVSTNMPDEKASVMKMLEKRHPPCSAPGVRPEKQGNNKRPFKYGGDS